MVGSFGQLLILWAIIATLGASLLSSFHLLKHILFMCSCWCRESITTGNIIFFFRGLEQMEAPQVKGLLVLGPKRASGIACVEIAWRGKNGGFP